MTFLWSSYNDREEEKRQTLNSYPMDTYRRLLLASHREPHTVSKDLETAIADIQILGTPQQVNLAQDFITTFVATGNADLDPLLTSLRDSLRSELSLKPINKRIMWLTTRPMKTEQSP